MKLFTQKVNYLIDLWNDGNKNKKLKGVVCSKHEL